jgi:hypothetical protein
MAMLRTALAERLGLRCHFEEKETSIYALTVPEGGHKLSLATTDAPDSRDRHMGIQGRYKVDLDLSHDLRGVVDFGVRRMLPDPGVVIKTIRTRGLNLESRKVPLKLLVVDKVNKEPTAN